MTNINIVFALFVIIVILGSIRDIIMLRIEIKNEKQKGLIFKKRLINSVNSLKAAFGLIKNNYDKKAIVYDWAYSFLLESGSVAGYLSYKELDDLHSYGININPSAQTVQYSDPIYGYNIKHLADDFTDWLLNYSEREISYIVACRARYKNKDKYYN